MTDDERRAARAAARSSWPVAHYALGDEPPDDLSSTTTALERLAMMWPLAIAAYSLSGAAPTQQPRSHAPIRIIRLSEDQ